MKACSAKRKGLALHITQSFPRGRVVKAMDFRSYGYFVQVRFLAQAIFFNDDGGASHSNASECKARALMQVQNAKPEGAKRPRMRMRSTKPEGVKLPRMRARSAMPEGAKRPSRHAGMNPGNVGASLF